MFKFEEEADNLSYEQAYRDELQLATRKEQDKCIGTGILTLENVTVEKAVHAEGINDTLISFGQLCDHRMIVVFTANIAIFLNMSSIDVKKTDVLLVAERDTRSGMYYLENSMPHRKLESGKKVHHVKNVPTDIKLWHNRLVHLHLNEAAQSSSASWSTIDGDSSLHIRPEKCYRDRTRTFSFGQA